MIISIIILNSIFLGSSITALIESKREEPNIYPNSHLLIISGLSVLTTTILVVGFLSKRIADYNADKQPIKYEIVEETFYRKIN